MLILGTMLASGCAAVPPAPPLPTIVPSPPPVPRVEIDELPPDSLLGDYDLRSYPMVSSRWVDSVLAALPLRRKVAQMVTVFTFSDAAGRKRADLLHQVRELGVGGVIVSLGRTEQARELIADIQRSSAVPVLISADFENGLAMRLRDAPEFPTMMALGAAGDPELAYAMGRSIAADARALGVQQNYAPVVDVNNNPANPVINVRSFGEDPDAVATLAEAMMRGLQDGGMIATAKHFPGHGDTDLDTHSDLPVIPHERTRLDSIELAPFRRLVDAGVLAVMTAHVAAPALAREPRRPSTLSRSVIDTLLRGELGFRGLVVTDALNMDALFKQNGGAGLVWKEAVLAGADVLLMPKDARACIDTVTAAVQRGEIPLEEIDRSVRRILSYKEWVGLADLEPAVPDTSLHGARVADSMRVRGAGIAGDTTVAAADSLRAASLFESRTLARRIARRAVTLVRNDSLLPLRTLPARPLLVSLLHASDAAAASAFETQLRRRLPSMRSIVVERTASAQVRRALQDSLRDADLIVLASYVNVRTGSGEIGFSADQRQILDVVQRATAPAVLLAFGSPYVVAAAPWTAAALCGYGADAPTRMAVEEALFGELEPQGRLPVSLPAGPARGFGLRYRVDSSRIDRRFAAVDSLVFREIARGSFPGAQLVVGARGAVVHARSYGRLSYAPDAPPVTDTTLFDIASMTKVIATTTTVMRLVDEGRIALDSPLVRYLPEFGRGGKSHVTIRQILRHEAGLPAFRFYPEIASGSNAALDTILAERLQYAPGTRTVYSDLGMIALKEMVERVTGGRMDSLVSAWITGPLGMRRTMYRPPAWMVPQCAPTERDTVWRHRLVQGEVHDETAALLGGVAGHAGLFSTAGDIARFAAAALATLDERSPWNAPRLSSPERMREFTRRERGHGSRALGWDTRSSRSSSAGQFFSAASFGHTGFTGTSVWIDPESDVFVVFLTNRVHPTRANRALLPFRSVLHDAVRRALSGLDD